MITLTSQTPLKACRYASAIVGAWGSVLQHSIQKAQKYHVLFTQSDVKDQKQLTKTDKRIIIIKIREGHLHPVHILSLSGQLKIFGQNRKVPFYPKHLVEVALANALAITILLVVLDETQFKQNRVVTKQISCIECMQYFGVFNVMSNDLGMIETNNPRGQNVLDGGLPSYQLYLCKNNSLLAVGNIENKFYVQMLKELPLSQKQRQVCMDNQLNKDLWGQIRAILSQVFLTKTAQHWQSVMKSRDSCITQVKPPTKIKNFLHPQIITPKL